MNVDLGITGSRCDRTSVADLLQQLLLPTFVPAEFSWRTTTEMQLLVSVATAAEAIAAVEGGADIIDAKDPAMGALGAVRPDVFCEIRTAARTDQLVTAALGDAGDATAIEDLAREFAARGAGLVKVGFAGLVDDRRIEDLIARAAVVCKSENPSSGVIAVAYAEMGDAMWLLPIAARAGARGVLIDTANKSGPGLMTSWRATAVESWVAEAHSHGLLAAVAGKLSAQDLLTVSNLGADVAGVRGAACDGGRSGRVSSERVLALRAVIGQLASTSFGRRAPRV